MSPNAGARGDWEARFEPVVCVTLTARLATATKAFCNCAVADDAAPNANTCPVCLGLPGTLPAVNAAAVQRAVDGALALGAAVQLVTGFAREHEPPDPRRPKGFTLTQRTTPLAAGGHVQIGETPEGAPIQAAVRRVYLTEDVGRADHARFAGVSALDFNLAGVPLLVVEGSPDLRAAAEVRAYVACTAALLRESGATSARPGDAGLTVVAHVAIRGRGDLRAGPACVLRGMSALDAVERAVAAECARQSAAVEGGGAVEPADLLWDATSAVSVPVRTPTAPTWSLVDPDLPPLVLTSEWVADRRDALPELPPARRARLAQTFGLSGASLDAASVDPDLAAYYETLARLHGDGPAAWRWLAEQALPFATREGLSPREIAVRARPADAARVLDLRRAGRLSDDAAAQVLRTMLRTGLEPERAAERVGVILPGR